jgi:hypothetical protein
MATNRKAEEHGEDDKFSPRVNIPAQEEEADIIEEAGAEQDEETGELMADVDRVRKLGAADPATVREDRRLRSIANKKRQGKKNVGFGTTDPLVVYETLLKAWEPDSIDITFKRLSGSQQPTHVIRSRPRSRTELYEVFMTFHGQSEMAEYDVRFHDSSGHQWRGQGRITMPDTRPKGNGHYPQQQPAAPGSPSVVVQAPPGQDMGSMFSTFQQMFDMFQNMQQRMAPQQYSSQPQMPIMPPQPPPTASPGEQMAWMQQVFDMFQRMQGSAARGGHQQPQHAPMGPNLPTTPPPPGYVYRWLPESNCCVLEPVNRPMPSRQEPRQFRDRAPYYPQGEGQERDPYARPSHQGPVDPLRESMSNVRRAMALREELDSLFGGQRRGGEGYDIDGAPEQDPDSPVIIERTADLELIRNREDGNIRGWDTFLVNLPGMIKQGGEYLDKISKTAVAERQRRERAQIREQLPPGYAYVEVPAEEVRQVQTQAPQSRDDLPPPPTHVPPPIREEEEEPPSAPRGWDEDL